MRKRKFILALSVFLLSFTQISAEDRVEQKINSLIDYIDTSLDNGTLVPSGPGKSAYPRIIALKNKLNAAINASRSNSKNSAITQLNSAMQFAAGDKNTAPLFTGDSGTVFLKMLSSTISLAKGELTDITGSWILQDASSQKANYIVFANGIVEDYSEFAFSSGSYIPGAFEFSATVNHGGLITELQCSLDTDTSGTCNKNLYTISKISDPSLCQGLYTAKTGIGFKYFDGIQTYDIRDNFTDLFRAAVNSEGIITHFFNSQYGNEGNYGKMLCNGNVYVMMIRSQNFMPVLTFYDRTDSSAVNEVKIIGVNTNPNLSGNADFSFTKVSQLLEKYRLEPNFTEYTFADLTRIAEVYDPLAFDTDGDGIPDIMDFDDDNDRILDAWDNCPFVFNPRQRDRNRNGIGDMCE